MIARVIFVALLLLAGSAVATERFATNNGLTSGTCASQGTACRPDRALSLTTTAGDIVTLLDGTYRGANNMLNIASFASGVSGGSGNPIIVRALNDGGVFIDGEFARAPFIINGQSYWTFQGFDAGNAGNFNYVMDINSGASSTGLTFQRIVANDTSCSSACSGSNGNVHVWSSFAGCANCLFEDIAGFGYGRNTFLEGGSRDGTIIRRAWMRWEGIDPAQGAASPFQTCYTCSGSAIIENVISIWNPLPAYTPFSETRMPAMLQRDAESGGGTTKYRGWISYAVASGTPIHQGFVWFNGSFPGVSIVDWFVDARGQDTDSGAFSIGTSGTSDRATAIKTSGQPASTINFSQTNTNECTSLGACPNFYTGGSPGTGARNCFRYSGGSLGTTPLWPWPMDDRIKNSIARAGATALLGTALTGAYAAGTVTSEIVSQYGSVPTACLSSGSFTPSFPVASDFPSVTVRDDFTRADAPTLGAGWTELLSDTFSIVSNAAAAPSTGSAFARATYSDTKMQTSHEVYATWTVLPATGGYTTMLSFAGTDLTVNNQYRVRVNRTSSANSLLEVRRVDGVGTETVIMAGVDLGIEAVDTNSFGVRVSGTTISVYWKWTDGIWYRVGEFTDSNLSTLPSTGVYGGIAGGSPAVIDNYGAGPFVDQAPQSPPTPPSSVGASRFGTTFPGVR